MLNALNRWSLQRKLEGHVEMTGHYTSHGGALHHFPWGPYVEEQVVASEGGDGYLVVKDVRAFDHWEIVCAWRYTPGVHVVYARGSNEMRTFYCPDEHLPHGVKTPDGAQP